MDEILRHIPPTSFVLDLRCARASFPRTSTPAIVVRLDREIRSAIPGELVVQADASQLPFGAASMDAIIANHSLEHFDDLQASLAEIRRVIRPSGALFVSVPDAASLTDRLYRWLADGGGHVTLFVTPDQIRRCVENATGLKHAATRTLCSSLSFLNRRNAPTPRLGACYCLAAAASGRC